MKARVIRVGLATMCTLAALAPACALAHTSYLKPNVFSVSDARAVTLEASFTEDFLRPEIAVESQDFHLYRPNGQRDTYDRVEVLSQMTVLESDLTEPGTYRFTTGERLGRLSTQARIDGQWRPLEPGAAPPAGAETRQSQTATVADVYVTKGAPTDAVVDIPVGRLAIRPLTHPSAIFFQEGLRVRITFDGAPLANQEIHLNRDGGGYDEPPFDQVLRTDSAGEVALSFERPGVYLIMTRHAATAPEGAPTGQRSYTTSLTFEAAR